MKGASLEVGEEENRDEGTDEENVGQPASYVWGRERRCD